MKKKIIFYFLIIVYKSQDCVYSPSFKILKARKHKPYLFAPYIEYNLSIQEELYDKKGQLYKSHQWNMEKKKDYKISSDNIHYINSISIVINKPVYNDHQIIGTKEIWRNVKYFSQKLFSFTNNWYHIPELPIKFLFRKELCFYNLSMLSFVKVQVEDQNKIIDFLNQQGTLVFYFSFDNSNYLRAYEREMDLLNGKSELLIDLESKLAQDYDFADFKSFESLSNINDK